MEHRHFLGDAKLKIIASNVLTLLDGLRVSTAKALLDYVGDRIERRSVVSLELFIEEARDETAEYTPTDIVGDKQEPEQQVKRGSSSDYPDTEEVQCAI